jgi:alpha-ketoglutarate-dependent taurine dioxygenase
MGHRRGKTSLALNKERAMSKVTFENMKPMIGATVHVARENILDEDVILACRGALEDRAVLVFPQLNLTDAEQIAFTDAFGSRASFMDKAPGGKSGDEEDVYKITLDEEFNDHPEYVYGTFFWHVDGVLIDQPPPKATLLSARKISQRGGQTEFANLTAAYTQLPDEEKSDYAGLRVLHTLSAAVRPVVEYVAKDTVALLDVAADMEHPLVWSHENGRKSLLIGTQADRIVGMELPYGRALLARLLEWAAQPQFTYSHTWQVGDFVIWDNTGAMHRVVPYAADSGRTMHRTSIEGLTKVA